MIPGLFIKVVKSLAGATIAIVVTLALLVSSAAAAAAPGQVLVFGSNFSGQLGNTANEGTAMANATPSSLSLPGASGQVVQTAAGGGFSLVVTSSGQLYAFGEDFYGQLGFALSGSNHTSTPTLVTLPGATGPVVQVAAGSSFSLAVTSTGQLYSFGLNLDGELGHETNAGTSNPNPTPALVGLPGAVGPVVRVAAGNVHSLALTASGQLFAFGANASGELGNATNNGNANPNPHPTLVSLPAAAGTPVDISAGNGSSLVATSSGQLYSFGYNEFGQLGRSQNSGTSNPNPTPTLVGLPGESGPVVHLSSGSVSSYALTSSGQLFAFGNNRYGQLGSSVSVGSETPNPIPAQVSLPAPVVQAGGGDTYVLAVTSAGQVLSFGANKEGELGRSQDAGTTSATPEPGLVELPGGTTVDAVSRGGGGHSLVITADIAVLTGSLPAGSVGAAYRVGSVAAGGMGGYSWSATGLPPGLSIDPVSGAISGTPTSGGTSNVVLHVSDGFGVGASSATLPLVVTAPSLSRPSTVIAAARPTRSQLSASLRSQLTPKGSAARLSRLAARKSYSYRFNALSAGKLTVSWYFLPRGAHISRKVKPVLFASGQLLFKGHEGRQLTITLTKQGRRLIGHRASLALSAKGSFTPIGEKPLVALATFKLKR
jgi:Regulator of chromosome condensation (RCC1) repeat/Putative Ig domain